MRSFLGAWSVLELGALVGLFFFGLYGASEDYNEGAGGPVRWNVEWRASGQKADSVPIDPKPSSTLNGGLRKWGPLKMRTPIKVPLMS